MDKIHNEYQTKITNLLTQIKKRWEMGYDAIQLQKEAETLYTEYDKCFENDEREYSITCNYQRKLSEIHLSRFLYINVEGVLL